MVRVRKRSTLLISLSVMLALSVAACDDDDEPSAEEAFCSDAAALETSVTSLADLDVVAEGTDGIEAAVGDVQSDLQDLSDSGSEVAADEIDALDDSLSGLEDSLNAAGENLTADNATDVISALGTVATSAQAVQDRFTTVCE